MFDTITYLYLFNLRLSFRDYNEVDIDSPRDREWVSHTAWQKDVKDGRERDWDREGYHYRDHIIFQEIYILELHVF